jgi:hypothetical protein
MKKKSTAVDNVVYKGDCNWKVFGNKVWALSKARSASKILKHGSAR